MSEQEQAQSTDLPSRVLRLFGGGEIGAITRPRRSSSLGFPRSRPRRSLTTSDLPRVRPHEVFPFYDDVNQESDLGLYVDPVSESLDPPVVDIGLSLQQEELDKEMKRDDRLSQDVDVDAHVDAKTDKSKGPVDVEDGIAVTEEAVTRNKADILTTTTAIF